MNKSPTPKKKKQYKVKEECVNKEINEVSSVEQKIVPITIEDSYKEIVLNNRDWMLGGESYSWSYQKSVDGTKVIMNRW